MEVSDEQKVMELLAFADQRGIRVDHRIMTAPAFSVKLPDGFCGICINADRSNDPETLAHELGHCETDAFYTSSTPLETVGRCEHRAEKWAIKKLVPKDELKKQIMEHREPWEIAEHFCVSERFLRAALEYYERI